MGKYNGLRTQRALERAKSFWADRDLEDELTQALDTTKQFVTDNKKPMPFFSSIAGICETTSHRDCLNVKDLESIDYDRWRLAIELRLLAWRIDSLTPLARPDLSWPRASSYLKLAIGLALTDREAMALTLFQNLASGIGPALSNMSSRKDKTRDWGAIAFVFRSVLEPDQVPKQFKMTDEVTLEQARVARPTYSDGRDPYGALLSGPSEDLIPVELIYLSRALGHPDPELAQLDEGIRATTYPTNEAFQEIDMELSIAGI